MSLPTIGDLPSFPANERTDLVAPPVAAALAAWPHADQVTVVEIDPDLADTATLAERYGLSLADGGNCVVVSGKRAGEERIAACLVRTDTRVDVNHAVKRLLDTRKASFHPHERAVEETGMEYGGITPIGLPDGWRLLVDARCVEVPMLLIGSGVRRSKLLVPGRLVADLPHAEVVDDLATPVQT